MEKLLKKYHQYILYIFVFTLPWQTIWIIKEIFYASEKWQYGTIGIYASDITLLIWIIMGIYLYKDALLHYASIHKKIFISGALLSLWGFLSIIWAENASVALYCAIKLSLVIDLFFLLQAVPIKTRVLSITFITSMSLQSMLGIYQFLTQSTFASALFGLQHHDIWHGSTAIINTDIERWLRIYGGFPHPNILGSLLLISLLLSLWIYASQNRISKFSQFLLLGSVGILFSGIILTFSRTVWITTIVSIIIFYGFIFLNEKVRNAKRKIVAPLVLLLLITALFPILFLQLFTARKNDTSTEHNSFGDRKIYLEQAQKSIIIQPLTGTGIGNYTNTLAKNEKNQKPIWDYQPVHNMYILIIAEIGFIGFVLFWTFIILTLSDLKRELKKITLQKITFILIITSMFCISLFDHWVWTAHVGILTFFFFLGLLKTKEKAAVIL